MANPNRRAFTLRLDLNEQNELGRLCAFFRKDPKFVLKQALYLLVESTAQLVAAQKEQQEKANENSNSVPDGDSAGSDGSASANSGTTTDASVSEPSESAGDDEAGN